MYHFFLLNMNYSSLHENNIIKARNNGHRNIHQIHTLMHRLILISYLI